jgi:predicted DNA-binding transcriptional regulator AlpA
MGATTVIEQENALTPVKAGRYLGVSEAVLRLWRSKGKGPRFFRAGAKLVRYRKSDLDGWIEERLSAPTADLERP